MRPGRMDRRITLQTPTTSTGTTGQPLNTYASLATVWANKREVSGTERNQEGQEIASGVTLFTIRWRSDVGAKERVAHDGVTYDIVFTKELGREQYLELHTERRTD